MKSSWLGLGLLVSVCVQGTMAQAAASTPSIRLWTSEHTCSGNSVEMLAEWDGNAATYELLYNGVRLATSNAPSVKKFTAGAGNFTLTLKGCRNGVCKTVSKNIRTMSCPAPADPGELHPDFGDEN